MTEATMRTYAIGDIHGYLSELERAHQLIASDRAACGDDTAPVVHVGDLCDRGPDTRGVIDFLISGIATGAPWIVLKGNHDRMFSRFLETPSRVDPCLRSDLTWLNPRLGGDTTLASYGVLLAANDPHAEAQAAIPDPHKAFVATLPTTYRRGEVFFCHAGVRPGVPLDAQTEDDLLWIRKDFHDSDADHGALVVHGHTPVDEATHYGNRVNIDTGAGYGKPISAVVIEGRDVWLLTEDGRVPLTAA